MQLVDIQKLQFSDKPAAESALLATLKETEDPNIESVELTPKPESLNSINGFLTYNNGERLFFKTHTEENEQINEYYNAASLIDAGYPIISTNKVNHRPGKQIALYEIITLPTLFDLLKQEEDNLRAGSTPSPDIRILEVAQASLENTVCQIYQDTLRVISEDEHARAPIHQLFSHRLADDGRLGIFYKGKSINLLDQEISFEDISKLGWTINGVTYTDTLEQIISRSRDMLNPSASTIGVLGHGDAHNGNVFVDLKSEAFHMFDPAFAGLHNPLLDLVKPLYHNIFARWMYFPEQVSSEFVISCKLDDNQIRIEHNFYPSTLRLAHLQLKKDLLIQPTLSHLIEKGLLPQNWRDYIHSALFCCPFLTVNLFAQHKANGTLAERYPLPIKMLGLSSAIALGSRPAHGKNKLSLLLDDVLTMESR